MACPSRVAELASDVTAAPRLGQSLRRAVRPTLTPPSNDGTQPSRDCWRRNPFPSFMSTSPFARGTEHDVRSHTPRRGETERLAEFGCKVCGRSRSEHSRAKVAGSIYAYLFLRLDAATPATSTRHVTPASTTKNQGKERLKSAASTPPRTTPNPMTAAKTQGRSPHSRGAPAGTFLIFLFITHPSARESALYNSSKQPAGGADDSPRRADKGASEPSDHSSADTVTGHAMAPFL